MEFQNDQLKDVFLILHKMFSIAEKVNHESVSKYNLQENSFSSNRYSQSNRLTGIRGEYYLEIANYDIFKFYKMAAIPDELEELPKLTLNSDYMSQRELNEVANKSVDELNNFILNETSFGNGERQLGSKDFRNFYKLIDRLFRIAKNMRRNMLNKHQTSDFQREFCSARFDLLISEYDMLKEVNFDIEKLFHKAALSGVVPVSIVAEEEKSEAVTRAMQTLQAFVNGY